MLLSICIPTFNRGNYLDKLLLSIKDQNLSSDLFQIVISDNASTDNTSSIIHKYNEQLNIKYIEKKENEGPDLNYMSAVDNADGKFCWLFGSDDLLEKGSVKTVLKYLDSFGDDVGIVMLGRKEFVERGNKVTRYTNWFLADETKEFCTDKSQGLIAYFNHCNRLGGVFSYLSSIIVNRASWDNHPLDTSFIGTAYSHAYRLVSIAKSGTKIVTLMDVNPLCRTGNDHFMENGAVKRFLIDIDGYTSISLALLNDKEAKALLKVLTREHGLRTVTGIFALCTPDELIIIKSKLRRSGFSKVLLFFAHAIVKSGIHKFLKSIKSLR
jgi:abequosyltransferase